MNPSSFQSVFKYCFAEVEQLFYRSHQLLKIDIFISLGVENEQADAGRDSRTRLVIPNSKARTGTGKY